MKKILINGDKINIISERKKFLSKKVELVTEKIELNNLETVVREEYENEFNGINFFFKDHTETVILAEEVENINDLENLYNFLVGESKKHLFNIEILDIETMETKRVK